MEPISTETRIAQESQLGLMALLLIFTVLSCPQVEAQELLSTVPAGSTPSAISMDPTTSRIYVSSWEGDSIAVINAATGTLERTIKVGDGPRGVCVNPATGRVYVANKLDDTVSVIDGSTNSVVSTIPVGDAPYGTSVDSSRNRIYVANGGDGTITVIEGSTESVVTDIAVGNGSVDVAVNPSTNRIYAVNVNDDTVSVIDGSTNSVISTIAVGDAPHDIAVDSSRNRIYVANIGHEMLLGLSKDQVSGKRGSISVIEGLTDSITATIKVGRGPTGLAVSQTTGRVYVVNTLDDTVTVIDGSAGRAMAEIPVGDSPTDVSVDNIASRIFVSNWNDGTLRIMNVSALTYRHPHWANWLIVSAALAGMFSVAAFFARARTRSHNKTHRTPEVSKKTQFANPQISEEDQRRVRVSSPQSPPQKSPEKPPENQYKLQAPATYWGGHLLHPPSKDGDQGVILGTDGDLTFVKPKAWQIKIPFKQVIWNQVSHHLSEDTQYTQRMTAWTYLAGYSPMTTFSRNMTLLTIPFQDENGVKHAPVFSIAKDKDLQCISQVMYQKQQENRTHEQECGCPNCQSSLKVGQRFCANCGQEIDWTPPKEP